MPRDTVSAFLSSKEARYIYNSQSGGWILQASGSAKTNLADYWDRNFMSKGYGQLLAKNISPKKLPTLNQAHEHLFALLKQWDASEPSGPLALDLLMAMQTFRDLATGFGGADEASGQVRLLMGELLYTVIVGLEATARGTTADEVRSVMQLAIACDGAPNARIQERFENEPAALYWETIIDLVPPAARPAADALWKALHRFEQTDELAKLSAAERAELYDDVRGSLSTLRAAVGGRAPGSGYSRFAVIGDAAFEAAAAVIPRSDAAWTQPSVPPGLMRYNGTSSLPTIGTRGGRYDPNAPGSAELARLDGELARERARLQEEISRKGE